MPKAFDLLNYNFGRLCKEYLLIRDYGKKPFKTNAKWQERLHLVYKNLTELAQSYGKDLSNCLELSLEKYAARAAKHGISATPPLCKNHSNDYDFFQAIITFADQLYGNSTLEIRLFDLTSEICELYEELQGEDSEALTYELGDCLYSLLRVASCSESLSVFMKSTKT
jgi:hypothetical protein